MSAKNPFEKFWKRQDELVEYYEKHYRLDGSLKTFWFGHKKEIKMICEQQAKKADNRILRPYDGMPIRDTTITAAAMAQSDAFRLVQGERGAHSKVTALKPVYAGNQAVRSPTKKQKEGKK